MSDAPITDGPKRDGPWPKGQAAAPSSEKKKKIARWRPEIKTLAEWRELYLSKPKDLIAYWLSAGVNVWVGGSGSGKTLAAASLVGAICSGLDWFGYEIDERVAGRSVLYFSEMEADDLAMWVAQSCEQQGHVVSDVLERFIPMRGGGSRLSKDPEEMVADAIEASAKRDIGIVVFDSLTYLSGSQDANSESEMTQAISTIDQIQKAVGADASLVIAHNAKARLGDQSTTLAHSEMSIRGSSAVANVVNSVVVFEFAYKEQQGALTITKSRRRQRGSTASYKIHSEVFMGDETQPYFAELGSPEEFGNQAVVRVDRLIAALKEVAADSEETAVKGQGKIGKLIDVSASAIKDLYDAKDAWEDTNLHIISVKGKGYFAWVE